MLIYRFSSYISNVFKILSNVSVNKKCYGRTSSDVIGEKSIVLLCSAKTTIKYSFTVIYYIYN